MKYLALLGALLLAACATGNDSALFQRVARLYTGMTREELTSLLGEPRRVNNMGALRVFEYSFTAQAGSPTISYYVIMDRDDRVSSFGRN